MNDLTENAEKAIAVANTNILQAQELMAEAHKVMAQQAENLTKETAKFEEMTKILEHVHFGRTIKLNVGGKIYKTSLDTLQKDPDSMLAAMFSGRFDLKPSEDDGAYFIDRDGKTFRYILNYLRTGELVYPEDKGLKKQFLLEVEFYQINGILNGLKSAVRMSTILTDRTHEKTLLGWLPESASFRELLYKASRDGRSVQAFHRYCDGKGPTLVLIKSGPRVLGGYTEKSWSSHIPGVKFNQDDQSFLFSISNPSGEAKRITSDGSGGLRCRNVFGPCFGNSGGYALQVEKAGDGNLKVSTDHNYGYLDPNKLFNDRNNPMAVDEVEVFEVGPPGLA